MQAAEMRARITALGMSLNQFTEWAGMDARNARRQAAGTTPVTPRTIEAVQRLETMAAEIRAEYARDGGTVILSPWKASEGGLPSSVHHAVAGNLIRDGEIEAVVYGDDETED